MFLGILVFHKISNLCNSFFDIDIGEFNNIVETVKKYGHVINSFENIENIVTNYLTSFLFTFDDGTSDHYSILLPLLNKHNIKAIFFISSSKINKKNYLSKKEILELNTHGHQIGSHSHSHINLLTLTNDKVYTDISNSKMIIEDIIGKEIKWFAPPGGLFNDKILNIAKDIGFTYFRTTKFGLNLIRKGDNLRFFKSLNISKYFLSSELNRCLSKKHVYYKYLIKYRLKDTFKKYLPEAYSYLRKQ
jgi:peptidoglycan/xylan/chitin deacetylase (PgdA/CDA1 family)